MTMAEIGMPTQFSPFPRLPVQIPRGFRARETSARAHELKDVRAPLMERAASAGALTKIRRPCTLEALA